VGSYGLDATGSGYVPLVGYCEHCDELSGTKKRQEIS
jgi:hypothetical protein